MLFVICSVNKALVCNLGLSGLIFEPTFPRLPISNEGASNTQILSDILRQGIAVHANELKGAKAVIDGNLVSP